MSPDPHSPSPIAVPPHRAAAGSGPADFAAVSKRIAGRTTDLIVIGIVLIGGLSMGRQVAEWWHEDPVEVGAAGTAFNGTTLWGDANTPLTLEFGNHPLALQRQTVAGDRTTALERLVDVCRETVQRARLPEGATGIDADALLAKIQQLSPVAEEPGHWQVYRLEEGFPLVLGVSIVPTGANSDGGAARRLVCWGLAAPLGADAWTLYTFLPSANGSADSGAFPEVRLPEGCRQLLVLRSQAGQLIGFGGFGAPDEWMAHFDGQFQSLGWTAGTGWSIGGSSWSARYQPIERDRSASVEVGFSRDDSRKLSGLAQFAP
jgi:hypothetical protein